MDEVTETSRRFEKLNFIRSFVTFKGVALGFERSLKFIVEKWRDTYIEGSYRLWTSGGSGSKAPVNGR